VQLTHIDNRSDAEEHGELYNWETRFDIAGADYTINDWTLAAESGWGPTIIRVGPAAYTTKLVANYLLVSRRLGNGRATLRGDAFISGPTHHHALTAAYFFSPPGKLRTGIELISTGNQRRVSLELRYSLSQ